MECGLLEKEETRSARAWLGELAGVRTRLVAPSTRSPRCAPPCGTGEKSVAMHGLSVAQAKVTASQCPILEY
jgi:hypothetical protein